MTIPPQLALAWPLHRLTAAYGIDPISARRLTALEILDLNLACDLVAEAQRGG